MGAPQGDCSKAQSPSFILVFIIFAGILRVRPEGNFEQADLQGWQEDMATLEAQLGEYQQWLSDVMLKKARANNQLPAAIYADNLKAYGVRSTPQELIQNAQYSYQFIRSEMKALA